jgi:hypothetical protein
MSFVGQSRHFGDVRVTSALPPKTDIHSKGRHVSKVPICDIARERRGLVEGHADPLLLAPDNVTGNVRAVRLKDKVKTLGNVVGVGNIERRPRNGHVAD